jgi:hypothetical protein
MGLFRLKQYLQYKWKAKGRHGTHSPFVYAFVEDVLRHSGSERALINNMVAYYGIKKVTALLPGIEVVSPEMVNTKALQFEEMVIADITNDKLQAVIDNAGAHDIIMLKYINNTIAARKRWDAIRQNKKITLSMDLYHAGLLFFRKEFKEKQHFVLGTKF